MRQVICRHCWSRGHSKNNCLDVKRIVAENPNSYLAESLGRKCSYCGDKGHTRPKCEKLADRIDYEKGRLLQKRQELCEFLSRSGVMPGTMARIDDCWYNGNYVPLVGLVTKIDWGKCAGGYSHGVTVQSFEHNNFERTDYVKKHGEKYGINIISPMPYEMCLKYNKEQMEKTNEKSIQNEIGDGKQYKYR